jgi:hypothetical protein
MSFSSNSGLPKLVFGWILLNKLTRIPSPRTPVYYVSSPYIFIPTFHFGFGGGAQRAVPQGDDMVLSHHFKVPMGIAQGANTFDIPQW